MGTKVEPDKETEKVSSQGGRNGVPEIKREYFKEEVFNFVCYS